MKECIYIPILYYIYEPDRWSFQNTIVYIKIKNNTEAPNFPKVKFQHILQVRYY